MNKHPHTTNLITAHGGYRELKSFQHAELVYDATVRFCDRFIDRRSRTHYQMVQAARSGRQNIAEGSQASGTSKKTELNWSGWRELVSKNCFSITKTFYDRGACLSGVRITLLLR